MVLKDTKVRNAPVCFWLTFIPSCVWLFVMAYLLTLLLLVSLSYGAMADELEFHPCMQQPRAYNLTLGTSFLEVRNTTVFLYARNNYTDTVLRESYIALTFRGIQEWYTGPGHDCHEPSDPVPPLTVDGASTAYNAVLTEDMECNLRVVNGTLPNGRNISSLVTTVRHPSYPNFSVTFNITKSFGTYEQIYVGIGNPNTNFNDYIIQYKFVFFFP
jgi:hypothetical protein